MYQYERMKDKEMKTRVIHTRYWTDSYVVSLTPNERLLYLYYLTNEHISISGVYRLAKPFLELSTGLDSKEIEAINAKLEKDDKVLFYEDWICVKNAKKYQNYTGILNELAELKELVLVPEVALKKFRYPLDTPTIVLEIRNKKKEIKNLKRRNTKYNKTTDELDSDLIADEVERGLNDGR